MLRLDACWRVIAFLLLLVAPAAAQSLTLGEVLTLPMVEAILLVSGGVFLILSLVTIGSGVAEGLCFLSFTLLFMGRYLQGEDLWVPLGLLVVGVVCLLAEVFVLPGLGVCGVIGVSAIAAMTVLVAGNTKTGIILFMVTTSAALAAGFLAVRLLPNHHLTRRLFILQPPESSPSGLDAPAPVDWPEVGQRGVSATTLRPGGYATFGDRRLDVTAENEFVPKGQPIEVLRVEAGKIVVRSVPASSTSAPTPTGG